ncbi:hypothetical protein ACIP79_40815 [Streptomyces sp. NPDC088747]|uniref:hypothetical protein n=1 Tax=Streptomyces sp. NPDC088747 TaxID=3365886 RepID=UPI003828409A
MVVPAEQVSFPPEPVPYESTAVDDNRSLRAAHTAVAALFHDNEALRQQLNKGTAGTVTPIRPRGPQQRR